MSIRTLRSNYRHFTNLDRRKQQEELIESFKREQKRIQSELEKLGKESQTLKEEIADCRKELSRVKNEMQELRSWMQSFAEFCLMLSEEIDDYNGMQKAYETKSKAERDYKKACMTALPREAIGDSFRARIKSIGEEIKALGEKAKADEKEKSSLEKILERVDEMLYEYPPELSPVCISLWDMPADQFEELKKDLKNAKRIYEDQKGPPVYGERKHRHDDRFHRKDQQQD